MLAGNSAHWRSGGPTPAPPGVRAMLGGLADVGLGGTGRDLGRIQWPNGDTIGFSQQNLECSACVGALVIIPNKVRVIQA